MLNDIRSVTMVITQTQHPWITVHVAMKTRQIDRPTQPTGRRRNMVDDIRDAIYGIACGLGRFIGVAISVSVNE